MRRPVAKDRRWINLLATLKEVFQTTKYPKRLKIETKSPLIDLKIPSCHSMLRLDPTKYKKNVWKNSSTFISEIFSPQ